jgi:IS30 family transposase
LGDNFKKNHPNKGQSPPKIDKIEKLINNRPRKCLDYKTPLEVYNELYGALTT